MERLLCAHCQDVIGSYEPIVVRLADGRTLTGALGTLKSELAAHGGTAVHQACHQAAHEQPSPRKTPLYQLIWKGHYGDGR